MESENGNQWSIQNITDTTDVDQPLKSHQEVEKNTVGWSAFHVINYFGIVVWQKCC